MTGCARCDFDGDLPAHATAAGHPLCLICRRSLATHETRVCERDITRARALLREIVELYALLPAELGNLGSGGYDRGAGSGERVLPGGDALVLLGPGSVGNVADRRGNVGEDATTSRAGDAPSVLGQLATWEDDARHTYGDPAGGRATVAAAASYLDGRMRWLAGNHDAFDEMFDDLRRLHARLATVTHRSAAPEVAPADCFACGARLVRDWTACGLEDDWHCERCRRRYTHEQYFLAVRARLEMA